MARGDLTCPIDDLVLALPIYVSRGDATRDVSTVGGHMHLDIDQDVSCASGHQERTG